MKNWTGTPPPVTPAGEGFSFIVVGIASSVNRSKEVIDYEICYLAAQVMARGQVRAEMHSGEDST